MDPQPSRRRFFSLVTMSLASVPIVGGLVMALRAALSPTVVDGKPARVQLCRADDVPDDGLLQCAVSYRMRRGPKIESVSRTVFVTKSPDGKLLAMAGECTHLACPVQNKEVTYGGNERAPLSCPCHGGAFSRTGQPVDGPPRFPLARLEIETADDGMVWLIKP